MKIKDCWSESTTEMGLSCKAEDLRQGNRWRSPLPGSHQLQVGFKSQADTSIDFLSKTLIRHLEALKITRHARKGTDINLPSPASWALELTLENQAATERTGFR